jgi:hypothetical protein
MKTAQLEVTIETPDLEAMERADMIDLWNYYDTKLGKLKESVALVLAGDPSLPANGKLARVARLDFKTIRVEIEKHRKEMGDYHLRKTQKINGDAKKLKDIIEGYEKNLLEIEEYTERQQRILAQERTEKMVTVDGTIAGINFAEMTEGQFADTLKGASLVFAAKQEDARKMEETRIAKEKSDKDEQDRIRLENAHLKSKANEERIARDKELSRQETERKKAVAAPDKEKILAFASVVKALKMINLTTEKGKTIQADIAAKTVAFSKWIENKTTQLE